MPSIDPRESFEVLKRQTAEAIGDFFPFEGRNHRLELQKIEFDDKLDPDDIQSQAKAKFGERTWGVPVRAKMRLVEKGTGKVLDEREMQVARLPKLTSRYSYIVDGTEWQVDNQLRLKSGAYHMMRRNGELTSQFNLARGRGFNVDFKPDQRKFSIKYGDSNIALAPILKTLGVSEDGMRQMWGDEIYRANMAVDGEKELRKFVKAATGKEPTDMDAARAVVRDTFGNTKIYPETTQATLGKAFSSVNGEALARSSSKLLGISRGDQNPDDRDSLEFKEILGVEDFISERIRENGRKIKARLRNNIDRKASAREILPPDLFSKPVKLFFTNTQLSQRPDQTNPLEMISGHMQTTITGEHGIQEAHAITDDAKSVSPSSLGFLDPVNTPEGPKTGVTLQMASGAYKRGKNLYTKAYNTKTGKMEEVDVATLGRSTVVFPDQVTWDKGKPKAKGKIAVSGAGGDVDEITSLRQADYVMPSAPAMFGLATNLIPFLHSNEGTRAMTASRQQQQAVPLKYREAPLVQNASLGKNTFEEVAGKLSTPSAPVSGEVVGVTSRHMTIRDGSGQTHKVQLYDNFPLNDGKSYLSNEPLFKKGDKVEKGQTLADSNFTRGGQLALGTNLKVGYLPLKGYNFEDGVVISESAAQKLTSEHLHQPSFEASEGVVHDKGLFDAYYGTKLLEANAKKLGDDGIIRVGQKVEEGDVIVAGLRKVEDLNAEQQVLKRAGKGIIKPYNDASLSWDKPTKGTVVRVVKNKGKVTVHVRTDEPAEVGDKVVGRHGNKGIITQIVPDHEMPHDGEGKPIQIALNPAGVPGRINLGQVLETAAGKIAEKDGRTFLSRNFSDKNQDQTEAIQEELKKRGLSDTETLYDPVTKKPIGQVLTGNQYILKEKHQVEKKMSARSAEAYDMTNIPKGGGPHGAQSIGSLGMYAMLAHGARSNIREMQTLKADKNDDFWLDIQEGLPIPPPKVPFAYEKFKGMLNVLGVDVKKQGVSSLGLVPLTDKDVLEMSNGELKNPGRRVRGKDLRPESGGLFDPKVTGGLEGEKWSHITLADRMPNPTFEPAILSLTGMRKQDFNSVMRGTQQIGGKTGPEAIVGMLSQVDVKKEMSDLQKRLPNLSGALLNRANRKMKMLQALNKTGMKPAEAYTMRHLPVLPPKMRPVRQLPTGSLRYEDSNEFYKDLALTNEKLKEFDPALPPEDRLPLQWELYDGLKALQGFNPRPEPKKPKGLMHIIAGAAPKEGYFQKRLTAKRQDLSGRSTIIPEPNLGFDEVGLPFKMAREMYKPFIVRELVQTHGYTPGEAQRRIKENHPVVRKVLDKVVDERPLLMKRDPVLHKFGVQAFKPKIVGGQAIQIHPLVTGGYNADFDGDTMAAFVPVTHEAVDEARKMFPSNNLFSPATGKVMGVPGHEAQIGLYNLSEWGKGTGQKFKTVEEAARAAAKDKVGINEVINVGGNATTAGRILLAQAVPEATGMKEKILHDPKFRMDKGQLKTVLQVTGQKAKNDYGTTATKLLRMGNRWSYEDAASMSLQDFRADKSTRDAILSAADKQATAIRRTVKSPEERDAKLVDVYTKATEQLDRVEQPKFSASGNRMYKWVESGARGDWDQFRQIAVAPMLVKDSQGRTVPVPIKKSYSEGLDTAQFWTKMHGVRMGMVRKTKGTQEPGTLTKDIVNTTMDQVITGEDCGTGQGILMDVGSRDIADRFLSKSVKLRNRTLPKGTLITPEVLGQLRSNNVKRVVVRSPLKCEHGEGMCAKCYGLNEKGKLHETGTNVGVISSQAIGEPGTQMALDTFHHGGVAARVGKQMSQFQRVGQLLYMPKTLPGAATLSSTNGVVQRVAKDPAGGWSVFINGERHYVPPGREFRFKVGQKVKKGDPLCSGPINPHDLLDKTNIATTQNYLSSELENAYAKQGVKRRNVEVVVRGLTNLSKVEDPGDNDGLVHGDISRTSQVAAFNRKVGKGQKPVMHRPILQGIRQVPLSMQEDWMARMQYQNLKSTVLDAAAMGWQSDIHGIHPIPGIVYGAEFGKPHPTAVPGAY